MHSTHTSKDKNGANYAIIFSNEKVHGQLRAQRSKVAAVGARVGAMLDWAQV
jgi:hypothetical protein